MSTARATATALEYYSSAYARRLRTTVLSCAPAPPPAAVSKKKKKSKSKPAPAFHVVLAATVFYPEGGGQPSDTGTVGGVSVSHVFKDAESAALVHVTASALEPGQEVDVELDWDRRFDLMQAHTAQHLLSGLAAAAHGRPAASQNSQARIASRRARQPSGHRAVASLGCKARSQPKRVAQRHLSLVHAAVGDLLRGVRRRLGDDVEFLSNTNGHFSL